MWFTFQETQQHLFINRILVLPLLLSLVGCSNPNADSAEAKLVIVSGIQECVLRNAEGLTTDFIDVKAYKVKLKNYRIIPFSTKNCYSAMAIPKNKNSWYSIVMDDETGDVIKKCGDVLTENPGGQSARCFDLNTW